MPDAMDEFRHLNDKTLGELHSRYQEIKSSAAPKDLSDSQLMELLAINRILRGRAALPSSKKAASSRSSAPSLDSL